MMNEITEFEKNLSYGLSFEVLIGRLSNQLMDYVDEKSWKTVIARRDAWVLDMPNDALNQDSTDIQFAYVPREEIPADILTNYISWFHHACIHEAAAQRAHNRKDADAAWALLLKARGFCDRFDVINEDLLGSKLKYTINLQAAANGGVHGQRARYRIVVLLEQKAPAYPVGFPDIGTAMNSIHAEMAKYLKKTHSTVLPDDLVETVKGWLNDHPAFRKELEPLFVNQEIEY